MATIGTVVLLTGKAFAINEQGVQRELHLGDTLQPGDIIIAPKGAVVELSLVNGQQVQISEQQTVNFTPELSDAILNNVIDPSAASIDQATIQTVVQAIASGQDINDVAKALENQNLGGPAGQDEHSFVDLLRIDEVLNQFEYRYDVASREFTDTNPLQQDRQVLSADVPYSAVNVSRIDQDLNSFNFQYGWKKNDFESRRYEDIRDGFDELHTQPSANKAPTAIATPASGNEDGGNISVNLSGTDTDGTIANVTVSSLPPASQGLLTKADGSPVVAGVPLTPAEAAGLIFTPEPNFNGTVNIPFTVTDNQGATSPVAVAPITVNSVNDAPTAANGSLSPTEDNTPMTVALAGSDVDGTIASYTITSGPTTAQGALVYDNDGNPTTPPIAVPFNTPLTPVQAATVKFVPAANYNGPVAPIVYTVTDNQGLPSAPATITVNDIPPNNDAPVAVDDLASTPINTAVPLNLAANDTDVDGDALTIQSINNVTLTPGTAQIIPVPNGTVNVSAAGVITFTPNLNYTGPAVFDYVVTDPTGATDVGTVTVNVGTNNPPTSVDVLKTIAEDTPLVLGTADFAFADADLGQTLVNVRIDVLPTNGSLTLNGNPVLAGAVISVADIAAGSLVFTPALNANGVAYANFTFSVQDSAGAFDTVPNT
ncbi:MAG: retention module-containing protein, partial [Methylotenera sp.]|nr:retention module-containing protein [Methylotenera sp.]